MWWEEIYIPVSWELARCLSFLCPLLCCPWGLPRSACSVLPGELIKAHGSPRKPVAWL